jgi:hypothetical protein
MYSLRCEIDDANVFLQKHAWLIPDQTHGPLSPSIFFPVAPRLPCSVAGPATTSRPCSRRAANPRRAANQRRAALLPRASSRSIPAQFPRPLLPVHSTAMKLPPFSSMAGGGAAVGGGEDNRPSGNLPLPLRVSCRLRGRALHPPTQP